MDYCTTFKAQEGESSTIGLRKKIKGKERLLEARPKEKDISRSQKFGTQKVIPVTPIGTPLKVIKEASSLQKECVL